MARSKTSRVQQLASEAKFRLQWWAVGARPVEQNQADKGIDGRLYFDDAKAGDTKQIILNG